MLQFVDTAGMPHRCRRSQAENIGSMSRPALSHNRRSKTISPPLPQRCCMDKNHEEVLGKVFQFRWFNIDAGSSGEN
jgi:hypothetical protein